MTDILSKAKRHAKRHTFTFYRNMASDDDRYFISVRASRPYSLRYRKYHRAHWLEYPLTPYRHLFLFEVCLDYGLFFFGLYRGHGSYHEYALGPDDRYVLIYSGHRCLFLKIYFPYATPLETWLLTITDILSELERHALSPLVV
jgi:hypothetical protein